MTDLIAMAENMDKYKPADLYRIGEFPSAPSPLITSRVCPSCGSALKYTGFQRLLSPPLDVCNCESCKLSYWVRTC